MKNKFNYTFRNIIFQCQEALEQEYKIITFAEYLKLNKEHLLQKL